MPEYTMPIFGVMRLTFESEGGSIKGDDDFFSVASTMPFVAAKVVRDLRKRADYIVR
jgi:hypothetical protein